MKNIKYLYFSFLQLYTPGVIPLQDRFKTPSPISIFNITIYFIKFMLFGLFPGMSALDVYVVRLEVAKYSSAIKMIVNK